MTAHDLLWLASIPVGIGFLSWALFGVGASYDLKGFGSILAGIGFFSWIAISIGFFIWAVINLSLYDLIWLTLIMFGMGALGWAVISAMIGVGALIWTAIGSVLHRAARK